MYSIASNDVAVTKAQSFLFPGIASACCLSHKRRSRINAQTKSASKK